MIVSTRDLPGRLRSGLLPGVVLLYGQEQGLIAKNAATLRLIALGDEAQSEEVAFDEENFFGGRMDSERFLTACRTVPFMATKRFIHVKDAEQMATATRDALLSYLARPSRSTLVVLTAAPLDAGTPLRKGCETSPLAWCIPVYMLNESEFRQWLRANLAEQGFSADSDALALLSLRTEGDTRLAEQELIKLSLFMGRERHIRMEDCHAVVGETAAVNPFSWADATLTGKSAQALHILERLLEMGEEPIMLLGVLTQRLRRLAQGIELLAEGKAPQEINTRLKIFWKEQNEFIAMCRTVPTERIIQSLPLCLETDVQLKGGGLAPSLVLSQLVIQLAGVLKGGGTKRGGPF